ncbi:hypothetical protein CBR_g37463 [Chara braunii]|uniref:Formyl transferase N-terminal domain-containing protein n=1 Tax=Chara braunii TaxID=69332 RepID=A0A388LN08_CHABU|nr:hypothetical protein CBR_g37463 [Chara braunii]|eukprot:GBG83661.1 hypothetical protein CBR_g37463 [Chara braunii]
MIVVMMTLMKQDKLGVVAKLSECVASNGANMITVDLHIDFDASDAPIFYSRSEFSFDPLQWPREVMQAEFDEIARQLDASTSLLRVFGNTMHGSPKGDPPMRMAILVSWQFLNRRSRVQPGSGRHEVSGLRLTGTIRRVNRNGPGALGSVVGRRPRRAASPVERRAAQRGRGGVAERRGRGLDSTSEGRKGTGGRVAFAGRGSTERTRVVSERGHRQEKGGWNKEGEGGWGEEDEEGGRRMDGGGRGGRTWGEDRAIKEEGGSREDEEGAAAGRDEGDSDGGRRSEQKGEGGRAERMTEKTSSNHERQENTSVIRFLQRHNIPYYYLPTTKEDKREDDILEIVAENTDFLALARYMQVLSPEFLKKYSKDIINIHHGLLPSFKGANPYKQAYNAGVKLIGATSHFVTEELDDGPIIEQMTARVSHRDSLPSFARTSKILERQCFTNAIKYYCDYRIMRWSGGGPSACTPHCIALMWRAVDARLASSFSRAVEVQLTLRQQLWEFR